MSEATSFDIAYLHPGTVTTQFAGSLCETIHAHPETKVLPTSAKQLVLSKNVATVWWLNNSTADWLLWVDQDMEWTPENIGQLLHTANQLGPSVVSALCFAWMNGNMYPSFFIDRDETDRLFAVSEQYLEFPDDNPFEVPGTGGGFMLVHREVLLKMYEQPHPNGYPFFFAEMDKDGKRHGYSQFFCKRAVDLGYKIWIEPRCEVKHHEQIAITSEMYRRWWDKQ